MVVACCPEEHVTDTCVSVACCPEGHVVVILVCNHCAWWLLVAQKNTWLTRVCLLLVVQRDTWLWYSYVITVHGGCLLPRRTHDFYTCVSVACCPEGHVVVSTLQVVSHCGSQHPSAYSEAQGSEWEPPSISTGITTVLGSSLFNEWSADGCWFGNCSSLICGRQ